LNANPLLQPWDTPYGLPPFARVLPEHFEPALHHAMQVHRTEVAAIAGQAQAPSFDNTLAAFDRSGRLLGAVAMAFYNLTSSATSPELQAVQRAVAGPLAAHGSAVYQNAALFARIDALHARRGELGLQAEPLRLLERTHLAFVRAGARLPTAARERHAQIMEELAGLTTRFAQNVLHDESSWYLDLPDEAALAGLPGFVRVAAAQAATSRGLTGHVIGLSRSLVMPFLSFSTRRDLRERVWRAWTSRGEHDGEHDNREVMRDILRLRREQATLHGHACYADSCPHRHHGAQPQRRARAADEVWPRALDALEQERAELLSGDAHAGGRGPATPSSSLGTGASGPKSAPAALRAGRGRDQALLLAAASGRGRIRLRTPALWTALQAARRSADLPPRRQGLRGQRHNGPASWVCSCRTTLRAPTSAAEPG
jgi:peptidyl-dipeptidase Dcp